jgi:hypothetical protein
LFCSAWRVGEVRTLECRDYFAAEGTIRLRPEHSKNKHACCPSWASWQLSWNVGSTHVASIALTCSTRTADESDHIIALDDLRRAAERGSAYDRDRESGTLVALPTCAVELAECQACEKLSGAEGSRTLDLLNAMPSVGWRSCA